MSSYSDVVMQKYVSVNVYVTGGVNMARTASKHKLCLFTIIIYIIGMLQDKYQLVKMTAGLKTGRELWFHNLACQEKHKLYLPPTA